MTTTLLLSTAASLLLVGCASTESAKRAPLSRETPPAKMTVATAKMLSPSEIAMADILDDPKKMAVFAKHAPTLAANSQLSMARGMTLAEVAAYAEAGLSESIVKAIVADMSKL